MASLFGISSPKQPQAQQPAAAAGIQVQTSCFGKARPVVFGTTAIAPNLIDEPPQYFVSIAHTTSSGGGGGGGK